MVYKLSLKTGMKNIVIDLSLPSYRVKHLECVKTITVSYPRPGGVTSDDIMHHTSTSYVVPEVTDS